MAALRQDDALAKDDGNSTERLVQAPSMLSTVLDFVLPIAT
jgi:hypothetical protein